MNGLTARGPRLLKTVAGKPWARREDHDDNDSYIPQGILYHKGAPPNSAESKHSRDVEADPLSSSDDDVPISSANIPASFDASGKSLRSFDVKETPRTKVRPAGNVTTNGTNNKSRRKVQKRSDDGDDDVDIFGEIKRKKPKLRTFGSNSTYDGHNRINAKHSGEPKGFINPLASFSSPEESEISPRVFRRTLLKTPNSESRGCSASQARESRYSGAEEYVSTPGSDSVRNFPSSKEGRDQNLKRVSTLNEESSSSAVPKFKVFESLTQAAQKYDPDLLRKEKEEEERGEKREASLAELSDEGPCPMRCGKILSRRVLDTLSSTASIKEQQKFCRKHQVEDAWKEREQKGYPIVDWDNLSKRLRRHNGDIANMIKQPDRLFFRKEMEVRNKKGRDRTLLQHMKNEGLEGIGVGYYGSKGLDVMTEHIVNNFATDIRNHAASDKVVAARGVTGYIQMVLVLELATLLIKEDMKVDESKARQIMSESTAMGELLNPSEIGRTYGQVI
ncbi:uncharacterized protein PV09_01825 [Verruconis gallopava]|uniref:Restriction of telomere capping protein 4 n=1 Tax=Verruconis gallopava TaxID=253628 RepID=A0A0D1XYQ6_9PEZI|nr:uncharacterized protein PV09_01825 [Verruconis gallopava]KIW07916.1 hypothetical protein PV09_01825 [Verruconis gallopava]